MQSKFLTKLIVEDTGHRTFVLQTALVYQSRRLGRRITVPIGFVTDFASIPRGLWNILPPIGAYDEPAVIHDRLYQMPSCVTGVALSRLGADCILLEGMKVAGVPLWQRWAIFAGVRVGGWVVWRKYRRTKG